VRSVALIFLLVTLGFPALEIYTMFVVADFIGWWLLAGLCLGVLWGWVLIKKESVSIFSKLAVIMQNGQSPFAALWDSGRTMLAGILLIFPGVLSDVLAIILLLLPNKTETRNARGMPNDEIVEGEAVEVVEGEVVEIRRIQK